MCPLDKGFLYVGCCAFALLLPAGLLAQSPQTLMAGNSQPVEAAVAPQPQTEQIAASELPESPGAAWSNAQVTSPEQSSSSSTVNAASQPAGQAQPASGNQDQEQKPQRPVGTAAAEAPKTKGVTAAEPSGVAIAPAKQRRVRTIIIRVGAIAGAAVAIGAVVGLTEATPSRPPGAH